jgi:O-methyltransferase involved in polyketide biosynthesis
LPTFFLWEGVVYYLEPEAVNASLDTVGSQCASGSAIAFDYFSPEAFGAEGPLILRVAGKMLQASGEPLRSGIPTDPPARAQVVHAVGAHGLTLERYEPFGEESANKKPFGRLVVAVSNVRLWLNTT